MAVNITDLKHYIGDTYGNNDSLLTDILAEATALVDRYNVKYDSTTETYVASDAPSALVDRAYLEVAMELWNRRVVQNGNVNAQFATGDGVGGVQRGTLRDPVSAAAALLRRWVLPW